MCVYIKKLNLTALFATAKNTYKYREPIIGSIMNKKAGSMKEI